MYIKNYKNTTSSTFDFRFVFIGILLICPWSQVFSQNQIDISNNQNLEIKKNLINRQLGNPKIQQNNQDQNTFAINDIVIKGLSDIEPQTVFTYLPIKIGEQVNQDKIKSAIQSLYATGLFEDVAISRSEDDLVITVIERKVLGELEITGTYEFDANVLKESLRSVGLFEGKTYDPVLMSRAEQELKNQYLARGFYSTKVSQEITPIDDKRIKINLKVDEGQIAKIRSIKILGNKQVSTSTILGLMDSTDSAFLSSNDLYSSQRLQADIERINQYYLDKGFLDFLLESAQVTISDDLNGIYISIGIKEGDIYRIRDIELANPSNNLTNDDFQKYNEIKIGNVYSDTEIEKVSKKLREHLTQKGFVSPRIDVEKIKSTSIDEKTVLLRFVINEQRRVTINRIAIEGNTRTSDEVIRREFRLQEGDLFNSDLLNNTRRQIERLGFFSDVQLYPQSVTGEPDKMDVIAKVKEKRTGSFVFGVTSSSVEKIGFNASISQRNWGGSGKQVSLAFNTSQLSRSINANYFDPYFTDGGLGFGMNAFQRYNDSSKLKTGRYKNLTQGGGFRFSFPINYDNIFGFGIQGSVNDFTLFSDSPKLYLDQAQTFGNKPSDIYTFLSYTIDLLDSSIYPTKGFYGRTYVENTISSSDFQYHREFITLQGYIPLNETVSMLLNTDLGKATSTKGLPLPYSKYLYTGGIGSVRGYRYGTIGPYDSTTDRYTGGDRSFNANFELLFPFPGKSRSKELRLALFADTGTSWAENEKTSDRKLRSSWGGALSWTSPVGPLRFSYAFPVNRKPGDQIQKFQFHIGTTF